MHWRGPGNRIIGGEMLRTFFILATLFFSLSAFACWRVEGNFAVDGETFKFNQKIEHNKEYKFPNSNFILSMTVKPISKVNSLVTYKIEEKKGLKLTVITKGEEEIKSDKHNDIFAKGEEGQPNSIISIKLNKI